jgi:hypothetical protein
MTIEEKTIKLAEAAGFTDIMLPMGVDKSLENVKIKSPIEFNPIGKVSVVNMVW